MLFRSDWRKWIEAVKVEIQGWLDNDAVEIVMFKDVPTSAKDVPTSSAMVDTDMKDVPKSEIL